MTAFLIIVGLFVLCSMISTFKFFEAAGHKGWHGFVPILNIITWMKVIKRPWWWFFLLLFPGVDFIMAVIINVELVKAFNMRSRKEQWLAGAFGLVYLPYVAFTQKLEYVGPEQWDVKKKSTAREWGEAIIFAVVAASIIRSYLMEAFTIPTPSMEKSLLVGDFLFVSKLSYGPKIPNTPLSFPFVHHTIPVLNTKSYLTWLDLPYMRLPGFGDVERNDVVVFNFPEGDTVLVDAQDQNYYQLVRGQAQYYYNNDRDNKRPLKSNDQYMAAARQTMLNNEITVRPVDKKENYIKRCVGVAGDRLQVKNGVLYINDEQAEVPEEYQFNYDVYMKNLMTGERLMDDFGMRKGDIHYDQLTGWWIFPLTDERVSQMEKVEGMQQVVPRIQVQNTNVFANAFPNTYGLTWTRDNYGPIWIPKKGESVDLTMENLPLYKRIIDVYEAHDLVVENGKIMIDGVEAHNYTFEMDYYFMMGDNRHNSLDSRFWGFVPEDHIVGKAVLVWLSLDEDRDLFDGKIRWSRMFSFID